MAQYGILHIQQLGFSYIRIRLRQYPMQNVCLLYVFIDVFCKYFIHT